jgi:hypothetical protein
MRTTGKLGRKPARCGYARRGFQGQLSFIRRKPCWGKSKSRQVPSDQRLTRKPAIRCETDSVSPAQTAWSGTSTHLLPVRRPGRRKQDALRHQCRTPRRSTRHPAMRANGRSHGHSTLAYQTLRSVQRRSLGAVANFRITAHIIAPAHVFALG